MAELNFNLEDFPHPFALNRSLLINDRFLTTVNSYKMACNSSVFHSNINNCEYDDFIKVYCDHSCLDALKIALSFCHMETLQVDETNLHIAIKSAIIYKIPKLMQLCEEFVRISLTKRSELCWKLLTATRSFEETNISSMCRNFILFNFIHVSEFEDFFLLHKEEFLELIQDDTLNVNDECIVIEKILQWINFNIEERSSMSDYLVASVKLSSLNFEKLNKLINSKIAQNIPEFVNSVGSIMNGFNRKSRKGKRKLRAFCETIAQSRRVPHEAIFVFGGVENGMFCSHVRVYDVRRDIWLVHRNVEQSRIVMPEALISFGIAVLLNRYVYLIGGESTHKTMQNVVVFDLIEKVWCERSPMHEARQHMGVAVDGKHIYAIGGGNGNSVFGSAERYDPDRNNWRLISSMNMARYAPATEFLNGKVYAFGGRLENGALEPTHKCEVYDIISDEWTFIRPMINHRSHCSVVSFLGHLYVLGGRNDTDGGVERYNPEINVWEAMPSMLHNHFDCSACVLENRIFCIAGGDQTSCASATESWAPQEQNLWKFSSSLPKATYGHRCVRIVGLETIFPYLNRPDSLHDSRKQKIARIC